MQKGKLYTEGGEGWEGRDRRGERRGGERRGGGREGEGKWEWQERDGWGESHSQRQLLANMHH